MGIGHRLKTERERLGYNQTDFAALARASKNTQYNYEKGDRSPDSHYLLAVAGFGVDIHFVLTGQRLALSEAELSNEEEQLLENFRQISPEDQRAVCKVVAALTLLAAQPGGGDDKAC